MKREYFWRTSQRADPLSWFTGLNLPVIVGLVFVGFFATSELVTWELPTNSLLQSSAALAVVLACLLVHRSSRPRRPLMRVRNAVVPLVLSWVAATASALGFSQGQVDLETWWGPLCVVAVIVALVPYSSAVALACYGVIGTAVCSALTVIFFGHSQVPDLTKFITAGSPPLQAAIAGAFFSVVVVDGVSRWRALPYESTQRTDFPQVFLDWVRDNGMPGVVGTQLTEFIRRVAANGRVSLRDREHATVFADAIRADLLAIADRSWLEAMAEGRALTVVDPDRLAVNMSPAQTASVRNILSAVLESPMVTGRLEIELRRRPDGITAVALSMHVDLPEGRRLMMLAPYFLSLKSEVDNLHWAGREELRMRFQLPADAQHRGD